MSRRKPRRGVKTREPRRTDPPPTVDVPAPVSGWTARAETVLPLLLIAAGTAVYWNSFAGAFLLDDRRRILDNPEIRRLWPPWELMAHSPRPIVQLSLAFNYAVGGFNVWGYHAFNLAVHLFAGLTLFGIVRRMLDGAKLRPRYG